MDVTTPSLHFSFSFSCREQENQLYFRLFFSLIIPYPKSSLKRKIGKSTIFIGFSFRAPLQAVPWHDDLGRPTPKVFQPFGWQSKAYLPGASKGFTTSVLCIPKPLQSPHLETNFQFSERWNLITSWFSSSCPSTQTKPSNWRAGEPQAVGKTIATSSAGAEPRKFLSKVGDLTAFGIVSTLANCEAATRITPASDL